jgi:hypothetical protein
MPGCGRPWLVARLSSKLIPTATGTHPVNYVHNTLDWNDFRPIIVKIENFQLSVSPDHYINYGD